MEATLLFGCSDVVAFITFRKELVLKPWLHWLFQVMYAFAHDDHVVALQDDHVIPKFLILEKLIGICRLLLVAVA